MHNGLRPLGRVAGVLFAHMGRRCITCGHEAQGVSTKAHASNFWPSQMRELSVLIVKIGTFTTGRTLYEHRSGSLFVPVPKVD